MPGGCDLYALQAVLHDWNDDECVQILRQIRQAGIREIRGDLILDDSYFDVTEHDPAAFDRQSLRAYNVAPNALMMNFKVVRFWFEPDHATSGVRVWLDPALDNLAIDNRLSLAPGACRGYQRGITILANDAMDTISLSGKFPTGCERYRMDRTALNHNAFSFGLITHLWRESGGEIKGGWANARVPEDAEPILEFKSLPLADVITRINKHSNNVMARQLLYTLSAEVLGEPGTEAGGRKVIADWLAGNGLELPSLAFDNGAGLSREARMSARDFGALLDFAWRQPSMPEFVASMSLSGLDGTLSRRFTDSALSGNAHLKTGSLDHVTAMVFQHGKRSRLVLTHEAGVADHIGRKNCRQAAFQMSSPRGPDPSPVVVRNPRFAMRVARPAAQPRMCMTVSGPQCFSTLRISVIATAIQPSVGP